MDLGARIKEVRLVLGHTQKNMANVISVTIQSWQAYEAGRTILGGKILTRLANLGINVNWLLTGFGGMMWSISTDPDIVFLEKEAHDDLTNTIQRQADEIEALELRIKRLLEN